MTDKTASIHGGVKNLVDIGTEVSDVTFNEATDYALLLLYMMSELGFTKTECKQFFAEISRDYREVQERSSVQHLLSIREIRCSPQA